MQRNRPQLSIPVVAMLHLLDLRHLALVAFWCGLQCVAVHAQAAERDAAAQASRAYRAGDLAEATRHWSEAIAMCRVAGDRPGETDALAHRGEALQALGQLQRAGDDLRAALALAERNHDNAAVASLTGALGSLYFQARDLEHARPLLQRSLAAARQLGLTDVAAVSANNLGNVWAAQGRDAEAVSAYDESARFARSVSDQALLATALINHARTAGSSQGELDQAMQAVSAMPDGSDKAMDLIAIGHLAQQEPARLPFADGALRRGGELAATLHDDRAQSLSAGYRAELLERQGRNAEATASVHQAILFGQRASSEDLLYRWEWANGRLAKARGNRSEAIAAYRRSVTALQSIRQDLAPEFANGRSSFRETIGPIYFELADLLLREAATNPDPAVVNVLLTESRGTVEQLRTVAVRDYFRDPCLGSSATTTAFNPKDPALQQGTALLYPIVLPDRVELLLTYPDKRQERVTSPVGQRELGQAVRAMRAGMETGSSSFAGPSRQLYGWLLAPIKPSLDAHHVKTLLIVPDGPLQTIPFAALNDGSHFAVADYAIATLPSLELTDLQNRAKGVGEVLLSGISKPVQGFPALPYVARELSDVGRVETTATLMEDERFRLRNIEDALRSVPYRIVHIASHGEFGSDPAHTFILTYDSRLTLDRLEQDIKYSKFRDDPLELLVLSACNTASGDDRAALGLAGVAVKAGARSAVATLWSINDQASAQMFPDFYRRLAQPGMTKVRALQEAQLQLMRDPRYSNPGYWASYLLIGNWM